MNNIYLLIYIFDTKSFNFVRNWNQIGDLECFIIVISIKESSNIASYRDQ